MLSAWSLAAIALILVALGLAWARRILAVAAFAGSIVIIHLMAAMGPKIALVAGGEVVAVRPIITHELGIHPEMLAAGEPLAFLQLLTHMFVHSGFSHLLGNLIVLLAFALPFEDRVGHRPFVVMYLVAGLAGAFAQLAVLWGAHTLMVGASGAIFGIVGAFAASFPRAVIAVPIPLPIIIFVRMKVVTAAVLFGAVQVVLQTISSPGDNTAYFAHLGGLLAGLVVGFAYVKTRTGDGPVPISVEALAPFATTPAAAEALQHLRVSQEEHDVFAVWMDRFLVHARSPQGAPLALQRGHLVSTKGERFDVRLKRQTMPERS